MAFNQLPKLDPTLTAAPPMEQVGVPPFETYGQVININTEAQLQVALSQKKIVLLDFWAPWCAPCLKVLPLLDQLAKKWEDQLIVGKLHIDHHRALVNRLQVRSIPTLLFFQGGKEAKRLLGKQANYTTLEALVMELSALPNL